MKEIKAFIKSASLADLEKAQALLADRYRKVYAAAASKTGSIRAIKRKRLNS